MRFDCSTYAAICLATLALIAMGCRSRSHYVDQADRDAYCIVKQRTDTKSWHLPQNYSIIPAPDSRLYDPDCQVCPQLPNPAPRLYDYALPYLSTNFLGGKALDDENTQIATQEPIGSPIPPTAWTDIPKPCLERMLDFESVREEAKYTDESFDEKIRTEPSADVKKLTLHGVVELALLNSRDYQTQKENLYQVALRLSLERFEYQTKFNRRGNGTALNYTHDRSDAITVNRLSIPSRVGIERMLVTGGDLLASFANNVLLTFNGTNGFAADVSSEILIEFAQPLLQVDVQFEALTQAERNLVYAARDFARFRKQFFVDFASEYYGLIRSFRQIEIDSQNYFSLVRAFNQAEAEYQAGLVPRFQVDQVEQSLLSGRGSLIGTCNGLEQSLDRLKLSLGIPTETAINLDLTELNELTRMDQLSVSADLTTRVLSRLKTGLAKPDRAELVSTAGVLLDRIVNAAELSQQNDGQIQALKRTRSRFLVDYSRLTSAQILADLQKEIDSDSPSLPVIFQRSQAHSESLLNLVARQLDVARLAEAQDETHLETVNRFDRLNRELAESAQKLRQDLQSMIETEQLAGLQGLVASSGVLRENLGSLVDDIDRFNKVEVETDEQAGLQQVIEEVQNLVSETEVALNSSGYGLKPIEIDTDDAMLTALALRYDMMNERGTLADDWRRIKLAADELRSILDFNASQRFDTPAGTNQPFKFSMNDATSSLRLTFDAPLNRRAERNAYRNALITYQRGLRSLTLLQDTIKFSVRNDLRNLALDREQYLIAVASAALAYERVVSTSLEFRLGTGGVSARDFLEAQTAYTNALTAVANRHINYIVNRTQLFFDLELLTVDENGFWEQINDESFQPQPYYEIPTEGEPVYGCLPGVKYSDEVRQMLSIDSSLPPMGYGEEFEQPPMEQQSMEQPSLEQPQLNLPNRD